MQVTIDPNPHRFNTDITVTQEHPGVGLVRLALQEDGSWMWVKVEPATDIPPSFSLPTGIFEAILTAGGDHLPPSAATDRHLADSTVVRDRLLALVERLAGPVV